LLVVVVVVVVVVAVVESVAVEADDDDERGVSESVAVSERESAPLLALLPPVVMPSRSAVCDRLSVERGRGLQHNHPRWQFGKAAQSRLVT
jgi:hypothetical protein